MNLQEMVIVEANQTLAKMIGRADEIKQHLMEVNMDVLMDEVDPEAILLFVKALRKSEEFMREIDMVLVSTLDVCDGTD